MQAARNTMVSTYLRPVATGLGVLYVVLALLHPFVVPAPAWLLLTSIAGTTALLLLGLRHYLSYKALPIEWVHTMAGCIVVLALGNSLLHVALAAEPQQSTNVALTILGAGCLLMHPRLLAALILGALLGWVVVVAYHVDAGSEEMWLHFAFLLIESSLIAWLIHAARCRTFDRLTRLRMQDAAIATSIISLAHNLHMAVTAEGVETEAQRLFLQQRCCDELQGFLISRPQPADIVTEQLQSWHRGALTIKTNSDLVVVPSK